MPTSPVRRTKIVATLGPSWDSAERMAAVLEAGASVVRINTAHGTPDLRENAIRRLQGVIRDRGPVRSAAILVDLVGPRLRVGRLNSTRTLAGGEKVTFAPDATAGEPEIPVTHAGLADDVAPGGRILLDDGLLSVVVDRVRGDRVDATVEYGGELKSSKGMNLPGVDVSVPTITDRDREEIARAVALGVDFIGISFVRRGEDVEEVRRLVPRGMQLVAKIEKDTALRNLEGILQAADALMVARGDLGVELPFEELPLVQKRIIREANRTGKPVITATQMLESMIHAPRPTRAEASDVANAILDGTDAVMLSAETAVGDFPVEAVMAMDRIAREVERHRSGAANVERPTERSFAWEMHRIRTRLRNPEMAARTEDAIAAAVGVAADLVGAPVIVCFTSSGFTARTVASYRPSVPIFAVTPEPETFRQLSLVWGVVPSLTDHYPTYDSLLTVARQRLVEQGLAEPGQRLVVTAGVPFDLPGTTNLLKIEAV